MPLTGIDPLDPTPATRRELIFGAGMSSGGTSRDVVLYGNRTAAGTEPLDILGTVIVDDANAKVRFGSRSELYRMYRSYTSVDQGANIYGVAATLGVGLTSSTCTLTYAAPPAAVCTTATTQVITIQGTDINVPIAVGDTPTIIAATAADRINAADDGKLEVIATPAAGVVTVVYVTTSTRGQHVIGTAALPTVGLRARFLSTTNVTCIKAVTFDGSSVDDMEVALASVANSEIYYHVTAKHTTTGVGPVVGDITAISNTDGGLGEHRAMIVEQALPINGKEQVLICSALGTQAQHTAIGVGLNSARAFIFSQEDSDWTPAMLAAHNAAVVRSQQIAHPSANFAGYTASDTSIYQVREPFDIADRPSAVEIRADLNNGVCPVACTANGKPYLVRFVTSRSWDALGTSHDYRARPGHVTSALDFTWGVIKARWLSTKQPFVANDPKEGLPPTARTSTPGYLAALIKSVIDDLASSKPLGIYDGPILAPDKVAQMKAAVITSKIAAGLYASADFIAVEHLYKGEFKLSDVGDSY